MALLLEAISGHTASAFRRVLFKPGQGQAK